MCVCEFRNNSPMIAFCGYHVPQAPSKLMYTCRLKSCMEWRWVIGCRCVHTHTHTLQVCAHTHTHAHTYKTHSHPLSRFLAGDNVWCAVWCVVWCGMWCVVCGMWCAVCIVWCVVCGLWSTVIKSVVIKSAQNE